MNKKLLSKKNHVLSNILLCLPLLICFLSFFLSNEHILISSLPFGKYLLYSIAAFLSAHAYYRFLMPLHETGHYLAALFFKKKYHLTVNIWIGKQYTFCSNWKIYGNRNARLILCAGMLFKFIYCMGIILILTKMSIKSGIITFIYVVWFEMVLNALPIIKDSDGYKIIHINAFYNEQILDKNIKEEQFVKRIYPWVLIGITIISIDFFRIIDNILLFLMDFL